MPPRGSGGGGGGGPGGGASSAAPCVRLSVVILITAHSANRHDCAHAHNGRRGE